MKENKKPKLNKKPMDKKKLTFVVIFILIVLLGGGYCVKAVQYNTHYFPNTSFNGIDIGNKTYKEAIEKIDQKTENYTLTLQIDGKDWKKVNINEINNKGECESFLKRNLQSQDIFNWPKAYRHKTKLTLPDAIVSNRLKDKLSEIKQDIVNYNVDKKSATDAKIRLEDGEIKIIAGKPGTKIQVNKAMDAIQKALYDHKSTLNLDDYFVQPHVTGSSDSIEEIKEKIEKIQNEKVEYVLNGKTVKIPNSEIKKWVILDDNGQVDLDYDKVHAYVTELAKKDTPTGKNYKFKSTESGTVNVPFDTYTWTISPDQETPALIADILKGKDVKRVPITNGAASPKGKIIGNSYVEVDLNKQKMFIYIKGKKVIETNIVSGEPKSPTTIGIFYVWNKERNAILRGPGYASPVAYWMPIDWTGIGIHDANWQPAFGGKLWEQGYGSHGCVNTPPDVMAQVFETVPVGTPVLVFKGNETPKQQTKDAEKAAKGLQ